MQHRSARPLPRAAGLLLLLGGCSAGQTATPLPATTRILDDLPRVENSAKSPCWQQEQVAAQNSYLASVKAGREVVYRAPCKTDAPKPVPSVDSAKAKRVG